MLAEIDNSDQKRIICDTKQTSLKEFHLFSSFIHSFAL